MKGFAIKLDLIKISRAAVIVSTCLCLCTQLWAQRRPNIVMFVADDLNQEDLGCYGNKDVRTPNINKLAAEGLRFTKAYAASSMCTPSRSVMYTGLYPFRNGVQMNHFAVRAGMRSLPHYLKELGYRVVIAGKTHVGPQECFPFEEIGKEFGKYEPIENRTDRKKETVKFIEEHFRTQSDQPLCLIVAPWVPHVPWFPNKDFDPQKLQLPDYLADTKETRQALAAYYQSIGEADKMMGEVMQAVDKAGKKENTVMIFTSDQGVQFPGAKWTVYDRGLRVPFIVRWPGKIKAGSTSDALISLVDITPTFIDLAGGKEQPYLDGKSFKDVMLGQRQKHHDFVFGETSVEPHYWYNYTPARTVITADGWHYIRNYHPGVRFITHIDKVERNEFYFDSWVEKAKSDTKTKFLVDRYSYRPPEELYDLNTDPSEFKNLADVPAYQQKLHAMQTLLKKELDRQGETEAMILEGFLPKFFDQSYTIAQNKSAANLSFNKKFWNPEVLYITAYLEGVDKGGVVCEYFNNFRLYAYQGKIGMITADGEEKETSVLPTNKGHLLVRLAATGDLEILFNQQPVLTGRLNKDYTKIKNGYVSCGMIQGKAFSGKLQPYEGRISDLRFTMNELSREP